NGRQAMTTTDPIREAIFAAVRAIPRGRVAAYGEVAARAGLPRRARLVGRLLREAPSGALPWHRVVRSDGRLAFPPDSEPWLTQRVRLLREVEIFKDGRMPTRFFAGREEDLDAALWG